MWKLALKHFAANNQENNRYTVNAIIDERTLREIYLKGFEIAIKEANPWSIMMAYNRLNGEYCCQNNYLIKDVLRKDWNYNGCIISDWGGTFEGFRQKIPYLKDLGINAVELMPIFEFDEMENPRIVDGEMLYNYWGYNTVSFFAPNTSYAYREEHNHEGDELKHLIRQL